MRLDTVRIISFSGIDGAGKSTHIDALCQHLRAAGSEYLLLTFWDDVVAFSSLREHMSLAVFRGDKGVGRPDRPIVRRDKNVSRWYLSAVRMLLYLFDALRLRLLVSRLKCSGADFLIFDRYIYDELANLPLRRNLSRAYVRILEKLVPKPDLAFLIDADPIAAVLRKPEYPLEFVRRNREAYFTMAGLVPHMETVPALPLAEATAVMAHTLTEKFPHLDLKTNEFGSQWQASPPVVKTSND